MDLLKCLQLMLWVCVCDLGLACLVWFEIDCLKVLIGVVFDSICCLS